MSTESFPTDIKNCMKACILAVLWPRQDIFSFFRDNGCTASDLTNAQDFKNAQISRAGMVDAVFEKLSARADGGLGQFRAMLKALTEWAHFDPYYFDNLQKLDRKTAQQALEHLRQLVEIRDSKIRENRARRDAEAERQRIASKTRETLLTRFLDLYQDRIKPQERGYKFEEALRDLALLEEIEVTASFRCVGEQIDGGLKFDGENYLLEAKWHDRSTSTEPLYAFAVKIEGKMYGRGIFVSVNGFMPEPVQGLMRGKALKTILVDGED